MYRIYIGKDEKWAETADTKHHKPPTTKHHKTHHKPPQNTKGYHKML